MSGLTSRKTSATICLLGFTNRATLRAFRVQSTTDIVKIEPFLGGYHIGPLIDAYSSTEYGGTGKRISLPLAKAAMKYPKTFLAGGLTPTNVASAVAMLHPFGVDVASGVEQAPGNKSRLLVEQFVAAVRQLDSR